jgi:hypothetical protein
MRKIHVVGASMVALSAALAGGTAEAGPPGAPRVLSVHVADYNAAQVTTANGILTVPAGLATYTVNRGTLEINSRFTVTLPSGFTFGSQPSVADTGATTFTYASGGIDSQTVTFEISTAPLLPGQSATLNSFSIQGATALGSPIPLPAALPITVQSTNNAQITNNDPSPLSKGAFASEPGALLLWGPSVAVIDLSSPSLGTSFFAWDLEFGDFYVGPPDTPTAGIMSLELFPQDVDSTIGFVPVLGPNGVLNALSTSDTATVTLAGLFNGISSAFFSSGPDCSTPVATGTATPTQVTIPGMPLGVMGTLCVTADGKTLLQANLPYPTPVMTPGTSTDFQGGLSFDADEDDFPSFATYIGGGVISVTNFFTGDDSGYSSVLRVNNPGTDPATLFALVQPDSGGPALSGLLGTLGAGTGTVFTEPQVQAAVPGLNLANSGQRSTLQLIVAGTVTLDDQQSIARPFAHSHSADAGPRTLSTTMKIHQHKSVTRPQIQLFVGNGSEVEASGLLVNPNGVVTVMPGARNFNIVP